MSAPLNPAILEIVRILAREAVRQYLEGQAKPQPAAPSMEKTRAE